MTTAFSDQPAPDGRLFRTWIELKDPEARARYLEANPVLRQRSVVETVCEESARQVLVDLDLAARLAAIADELAATLDDEYCLGRARRAMANVAHQKGTYREAMELYSDALEMFQRADNRLEQAITRSSSLHNLIYLGEYERAFDWAEKARAVFEERGDRLRLARLDLNFANILYRQDRLEQALELYESAETELAAVGDPRDMAICLRNMAVCLITLDDFFRALQVYQQARDHCLEHSLPVELAEIDYNIAYLHYLRGDHAGALKLFQAARAKAEELGDEQHIALCDLDQSEIFLELNLIDEAAQLAEWAFERFDRVGMQYEAAKALTNLSVATIRQGKDFLGLELLARAREIFVREQNQVWPALLDLYQALALWGERRLFDAATLAQRAKAVFEEAALESKTATCEILLARLELERGDLESAAEFCRSASDRLEGLNQAALSYQAYFVLGQTEEQRGNRSGALDAYEASRIWLERWRGHLKPSELKISILDDRLEVYERLVALSIEDPERVNQDLLFSYFEKAKSRSLTDLIAFRANALPVKTTTRSSLVEEIRGLREELNWYHRQIDLRQMRPEAAAREQVGELRENSRRREEELQSTLRELGEADREFSALQQAATVDLPTIRKDLPEDTLLVEYYAAKGKLYGAVVGHEKLEIIPLTLASRVREMHKLLQFQLSKFLVGAGFVDQFSELIDEATKNHLKSLHSELVEPLRDHLDRPRLVVIPHGHLHHAPFHGLFDGARYLGEEHAVSYAPSASFYHLCRAKGVEFEERALLVDVVGETSTDTDTLSEALSGVVPTCEVLAGENAGEEALRGRAKGSRILHLATHAVYRQDNPMFSTLELSGSRLSFFDLYHLDLNAELVVLTGCGSSLSLLTEASELVGLAQGLLYAGAKSVLLSLWETGGENTTDFLRIFYEKLALGGGAALALQKATREYRLERPQPFFWAPYALIGDPG